jgi:mannose-6-phosphate isomerase-like protein (cupin superfamily)
LGGGAARGARNRLSLQKHFHRSEHWVRLANPGKILLELIEVQVGSYLGEDNIVRLDDVYGRG